MKKGRLYNRQEIEIISKSAIGKSINDILNEEVITIEDKNYPNKGGLGQMVEQFLFGIQTNSDSEPDFMPAGIELKVTPYKKIKGPGVEENAMYLIKANAPINTEAFSYAQTQMASGKVKFLIDESAAKSKLMQTKVGQNMNSDKRNEYLQPFVLTSVLREQMLNLVEENEGVNILLKQSNRSIKKDKFSAFVYGLYYIKKEEDKRKRRKSRDISKMLFFS